MARCGHLAAGCSCGRVRRSTCCGRVWSESGADRIFAAADASPYARRRDAAVSAALPLTLTAGLTVHPLDGVRKKDGGVYTVFTPYSRAWRALPPVRRADLLPAPARLTTPPLDGAALPASQAATLPFPPGEAEAQRRLRQFARDTIYAYEGGRNRVDLDGTSGLSPYLRFGQLSPRQAAVAAGEAWSAAAGKTARDGAATWLTEIIWREFYLTILYHFPHVRRRSFRDNLQHVAWRNDPAEFAAWQAGLTGYPVVDAAMRQLAASGWMHNRARMIVASFLVKDLLIDWRWGEQWFMQQLVDGDPAANNGGWQWSAGTGTDAAPYFRIFNPTSQSVKFDPHGDYIRRWVPELARVSGAAIHAPQNMTPLEQHSAGCVIGRDYPAPIVDHKLARERTLAAYRAARDAFDAAQAAEA